MSNWLYNLIYGVKDKEIQNLKEQIKLLFDEIENKSKQEIKEEYYNNKYPQVNLTYKRIETDGIYQIDLRNFINPNDFSIPLVSGITDDEIALKGLKWVMNNIKYKMDSSNETYKTSEYWAYPYQTLIHKAGDCEDGAILLYNILLKSGIPYWKLRLTAGFVKNPTTNKKEGHCYLTYYCQEEDKWVILDWCWFPNTLEIKERKEYKEEENYLDVWFSWNMKYCFTEGLNKDAKHLLNLK